MVSLRFAHALIGFICGTVAGCTAVGPNYVTPPTEAPAAFINAYEKSLAIGRVESAWWHQFKDPVLDDLVARALRANHDMRVAAARVQEARAFLRETDYERFPHVTAEASATERRLAEAQAPGLPRERRDNPLYIAGFDASWEIDLFGRVKRSIEAAAADAERVDAGLRDVTVTVIAEVSRNYFELRGLERQLAVARSNVENERGIVSVVQVKADLGRGIDLDIARARAQLQTTIASVPLLEGAIRRAQYRLAVLTGERPDRFRMPPGEQPLPTVTREIPIGNPTELLRRRADVRAAERALASATANVGIATADLFPRVTLLGFIGIIAASGGAFGATGSHAYSLGASLAWPAFDLGRFRERLRGAEARAEGALAFYEQTVLRVLEEAESAFVSFGRQQTRLVALREAERESARAAELARLRYDFGIGDFLSVLDAERTLNNARDRVAQNETQLYTTLIAVYKALGGGWEVANAEVLGAR